VSGSPLVPAPVYGLRTWTARSGPDGERLGGPHQDAAWPAGGEWLEARCRRTPEHAAPAPGCECGIHAWHPSPASARRVLAGRWQVPGVLEARGAIEVHEEGFRAQQARPYALVAAPGRNAPMIGRLAAAHGVPVVAVDGPQALLAWCRERGLGLGPDVVALLIGAEEIEAGRRARRRAAVRARLRIAVTVAVAVALLVGGMLVAKDPPGERTLTGRAGEIHTH
jgi:hypothetical protein